MKFYEFEAHETASATFGCGPNSQGNPSTSDEHQSPEGRCDAVAAAQAIRRAPSALRLELCGEPPCDVRVALSYMYSNTMTPAFGAHRILDNCFDGRHARKGQTVGAPSLPHSVESGSWVATHHYFSLFFKNGQQNNSAPRPLAMSSTM